MSGTFLHTNILMYVLAKGDPRQPIAVDLVSRGGTISVQVLSEFANVARRRLKLSWPEVTHALAAMRALCAPAVPLTLAIHDTAMTLAQRHGFAFYDSLIVAAALDAGCATLLSEGMQDGQVVDGRLTIRDPFRAMAPPAP